jgi:hypothetical protein
MQAHKVKRSPGGQPGNKNALQHGRRTYAAIAARKAATARVKAAAVILHGLGAIPGRCRRRLLRPDQVALIPAPWRDFFPLALALSEPGQRVSHEWPFGSLSHLI